MPPNDEIVARDPELSGLGLLLDRRALEEGIGAQIERCGTLRYKPGTSCSLAVRLADGRDIWLKALSPERHAEVVRRGHDQAPPALRSRHVLVQTPDADRDVPGLRRFWPEGRRDEALKRLMGDDVLARARMVPLSHRPTRRLVARLDHSLQKGFLKLYSRGAFARANAGATVAAVLGHGRLRRASASDCALVSDWIAGSDLCPTRRDPIVFATGRSMGRALAAIHDSSAELPFQTSRHHEIRQIEAAAADLSILLPSLAERVQQAAQSLCRHLASVPAEWGLLHGDFTSDQVIVDPAGRLHVIDWDRAGMGDRGADIGTALARVDAQELWGDIPRSGAEALRYDLLTGYEERRGLPASWPVQRSRALFLLLSEPFRRQLHDWSALVAGLLDLIETKLDTDASGAGDVALPHLPTLATRAGAARAIGALPQLEVSDDPKVLRHKPGRRALVEIPCRSREGRTKVMLAKTRSKHTDHVTPAYHEALRAAGFGGRAARFGVPRAWAGPSDLRSWVMEKVPGRALTGLLDPAGPVEPFFQTGRMLAKLHATRIEGPPEWSLTREWEVLQMALASAARRIPEDAETIVQIARLAKDRLGALKPNRPVLLHRDFYPDQVLVEEARLWLIDLDLLAVGDPHIDLGNFHAHLDEHAIRNFGGPDALSRHAAAFFDGYRSLMPCDVETVELLRDISLARHIDICFRVPGRNSTYRALLTRLQARFTKWRKEIRLDRGYDHETHVQSAF
jgi:aminoglycoside phosphotransferase (APT) family kinase protein